VFFVTPGGVSYLVQDESRDHVFHFYTANKMRETRLQDKVFSSLVHLFYR
jgi:hypothetical protein